MEFLTEKYRINIFADQTFTLESSDNVNQYDFVYFDKSDSHFSSVFGIKVFQDDFLIKSAIISSSGGGTGMHKTSQIIEIDRLLVCCSNSVYCLSLPDLALVWKTKADEVTCFEILKFQDRYIIHGELEISMIDQEGKILWQQSGADIFTTLEGKDEFIVTDKYILATDWGNRKYKFDFDGKKIDYKK